MLIQQAQVFRALSIKKQTKFYEKNLAIYRQIAYSV